MQTLSVTFFSMLRDTCCWAQNYANEGSSARSSRLSSSHSCTAKRATSVSSTYPPKCPLILAAVTCWRLLVFVFPCRGSASFPMPLFFRKVIPPVQCYTCQKRLPRVRPGLESKSVAVSTEESELLMISIWIIHCLFQTFPLKIQHAPGHLQGLSIPAV